MPKTPLIGTCLLLLVSCNRYGDFKAALDTYALHLDEMTALLQGMEDEASIREAEPQIDAILQKIKALKPRMKGPPEGKKAQLLRNHQGLAASIEGYTREIERIGKDPELGARLTRIMAAKAREGP